MVSPFFRGEGGGGGDFCVNDRYFNRTIAVVTFCLRGCCTQGVFLLPAFTGLGHGRQILVRCDWAKA